MCTMLPQLQLKLFHLFHLVIIPSICLAEQLDDYVLDGDITYCGLNVTAPFSYSDNLHGLQVICDFEQKSGAKITLGRSNFTLLEISREGGYIRVMGKTTTWRCNQHAERPGQVTQVQYLADHDLNLNLEGTPFTFSHSHNKLTVLGCDAFIMLENFITKGSSGCVSFCPNNGTIKDGKCMGAGCCQASIPPDLKSFNVTPYSIKNLTASSLTGISGCTQFFVGEMDPSQFKSKYVVGDGEVSSWPVVLEWAIGNESCTTAMGKPGYACLAGENSSCYDVKSGKGYRCNCKDGFEGNPYVLGGCQDVDECSSPNKNNCTWKCQNFNGGSQCLCPPGTKEDGRGHCERSESLEIVLALSLVLLTILFGGGILTYWGLKKRKIVKIRQRYFMQNGGMLLQQRIYSQKQSARIFSIDELRRATDGFSEEQVIGKGGYGTVYKGLLSDGQVVAIKKSKLVDESQIEHFINEVVILSQINHKNVVKLLGCCLEDPVPLLIYEFIQNGTLFDHIHENSSTPLSWEKRLRVVTETASALAYLHCKAAIPIIHRDIKSTNILLDENYTAKISDFGASRLVAFNKTHITTLVQGTLGYLDPEYFFTSQLTEKSDVYSFGVVLMETLTGQMPVSLWKSDMERNLASHFVGSLRKGRLCEVIDGQLVDQVGPLHLFAIADLASRCVELKGEERPTMYEVAVELNALRRLLKNQCAMLPLDKEQPYFRRPLTIYEGNSSRETNPEISLLSSIDI
ncbi:Wall-associated kinase family protein [Rhynchospora pubera]|uniref:Wall-associated kinase family protein n=1 Tax=Rhynchospora pubera TaxID=906938 RepID=A0AAV8EU72_9POAL|nr:Wall-associated kinase family protein [Rhynchospora pubera]